MKRILVIGNGGAGKSTLAQFLAMRLHLPLLSLDKLWWLPGWQPDTRENFDRKLAAVLKQEDLTGNSFAMSGISAEIRGHALRGQ